MNKLQKKNDVQSPVFTQEFTLKVFYILSKYATLLKKTMGEDSFKKRIQLLRQGKDEDYYVEYIQQDNEEAKQIGELKNIIYRTAKITEHEYVISY